MNSECRKSTRMKRFRFTLQALLTVRQRQEQVAMESYAAALQAQRRAAEALRQAEVEMVAAARRVREEMAHGLMADRLRQLGDHFQVLTRQKDQAADRAAVADRAVAPALREMLEARRRREAVGEFQAKQRLRHQRESQRQEGKQLDELAQRRSSVCLAWRGNEG